MTIGDSILIMVCVARLWGRGGETPRGGRRVWAEGGGHRCGERRAGHMWAHGGGARRGTTERPWGARATRERRCGTRGERPGGADSTPVAALGRRVAPIPALAGAGGGREGQEHSPRRGGARMAGSGWVSEARMFHVEQVARGVPA